MSSAAPDGWPQLLTHSSYGNQSGLKLGHEFFGHMKFLSFSRAFGLSLQEPFIVQDVKQNKSSG